MKKNEKTKYQFLKEISAYREQEMSGSAVEEFYSSLHDVTNYEKLKKLLKEYFSSNVGVSLKDIKNFDLENYINSLGYGSRIEKLPKIFNNKDVVSNLAYYLASKLFKMKEGINLKYVIYRDNFRDNYFFFDPELEELFGFVTLDETDPEKLLKKFCGKKVIPQIKTSVVDKELRGTGLGKYMYLTLIKEFGCLASDHYLFGSAMNMWVNVLKKHTDVYYLGISDFEHKVQPITKKIDNLHNVDFFFAVNK